MLCCSYMRHIPSTTASKMTSAPWSTILPLSGEINLGAVDFLVGFGEDTGVEEILVTVSWWSATPFTTLTIVCWWITGVSWFCWWNSSVFWLWTFKTTAHTLSTTVQSPFANNLWEWQICIISFQFWMGEETPQHLHINSNQLFMCDVHSYH